MAKQKSEQKKADMLVLDNFFIRSATQHVHIPARFDSFGLHFHIPFVISEKEATLATISVGDIQGYS